VPQALVRVIAESGRKSLYLASHAGRIFGMPETEGRALIDELIEHATRRQFVYTHRWRVNDLVMWDNRCTMHRGRPFDDQRWKRDAQRATVEDVANTLEQEGIRVQAVG
jgi:alpha-ketoglutarate-dependent 2,4-dichlorophenoxyacetate dioxygenase